MKKIFLAILILPIITHCQLPETLIHNQKYYVDDYINVFTSDQIVTLDKDIRSFIDTAQISIVAINTFGEISPSDYAVRLGRKWGVGGQSNNGLLIIVAIKDRHIEVATGYGLEGDLPDIKVVELQQEFAIPLFKQGKYYEGVEALLRAYINQLSPSAKSLRQKEQEAQKLKDEENWRKLGNFTLILFGSACIGFLIYIPFYRKRKKLRLQQEEKDRLFNEKLRHDNIIALATLGSAYKSSRTEYEPPTKSESKEDDTYTPPPSSYDSSSNNDDSPSISSDFGGGSFGGGGGGSDW